MFERLIHMLTKEFIQTFRDPRMRTVIFVTPIIQTLMFGYVVTTDVTHVPTAVFDLDNSQSSRELVASFTSSGYFDLIAYVTSEEAARNLFDRGVAKAVLRMNRGFEDDLLAGRTALLQIQLDGTDSNTAGIVLAYTGKITSQFSNRVLVTRSERTTGQPIRPDLVNLRSRAWFNENLESRNFFVPGVIVLLISLVTLMLASMAIVREKEVGTIEQIMVTPITQAEFVLGKTIPFAVIGYINVALVTAAGVYWFQVPFRGSLLLLFAGASLYLMNMLGVGLLISTLCRTQQQAMMSTFFYFFPAMLLSGFVFPITNMPEWAQWLTYANPVRYFLVIVRSIFLKGVGAAILWPQLAALALLGGATLQLAVFRFRKTTD